MNEIEKIIFPCGLAIEGTDIFNGLEIKDIKCPLHNYSCFTMANNDYFSVENIDENDSVSSKKDLKNNKDKEDDKNDRL